MQNIQQLINSISLPEGTLSVIGLTTTTGKYQLDIEKKTLELLTVEGDVLGQVFPKLTPVNAHELDISKVTRVGYKTKWSKKAKIVTPKIVDNKLTF